ncbi:protein FAM177A1-like [Littorina saxatilis]|uniref:Protein FAM177A1 n=1 Tax=Littorina saxatilis TaxID=31220 RepID=A0AAN9BBX7_9CAEN
MSVVEADIPRVDQAPAAPASYGGTASGVAPFTSVALGDGDGKKKGKVPRRILHFSDGILEEYSTDEEEEEKPEPLPLVDPKTLKWMPWMWFYMSTAAYKSWKAADFCGEKLAWFFGITAPKYQSAIDEYYRRKEEEELDRVEEEKRLSRSTLNTELSASAIDVQVVENTPVVVGENLTKY